MLIGILKHIHRNPKFNNASRDFAASTEEISATGQELLAYTEIIANSAKELDVLAI